MANELFEIPKEVIEGWNFKKNMREWELSKFVPFARLYYVFDKNIDKETNIKQNDKIYAKIIFTRDKNKNELLTKNVILLETGGMLSQTSEEKNFRGGFGIKDCSIRYNNVEAGAFETNISVFISNLQQINESFAIKKLFYPGSDFVLIYGWSTDNDEGTFFKTSNNEQSNPVIIDLTSFDGGMRRNLYCTLHSFNWEFSEIGKIEGSLKFFAPDTIRSTIRNSRYSSNIINAFLSDDIIKRETSNILYDKLYKDTEPNKKLINELNEKYKRKVTRLQGDNLVVVEDDLGIRIFESLQDLDKDSKITLINADNETYVYIGWVLETIKNQMNINAPDEPINIFYEDIDSHEIKIDVGYIDEKGNQVWQSYTSQITNSFFIPINLKVVKNFISQYRGNLKDLLIDIPEIAVAAYKNLDLGIFKSNNTTWILDDKRNKLSKIYQDYLKNDNNGTVTQFDSNKNNTITVEFGTKNSLTFNVKISSLIPPDLIWTLGLRLNESEAATLIRKALDNEELRTNNEGYRILYEKYIKNLEIDKTDETERQIKENLISGKNLKSIKENPKIALRAWKSATSENPISVYRIFDDGKTQDQLDVGTILMNYFNGLMLTIHGTTGIQAYKTFLFKGFDSNANLKGIDGLYSVILVNDIINKRGFQTVIESSRIRSGSVI